MSLLHPLISLACTPISLLWPLSSFAEVKDGNPSRRQVDLGALLLMSDYLYLHLKNDPPHISFSIITKCVIPADRKLYKQQQINCAISIRQRQCSQCLLTLFPKFGHFPLNFTTNILSFSYCCFIFSFSELSFSNSSFVSANSSFKYAIYWGMFFTGAISSSRCCLSLFIASFSCISIIILCLISSSSSFICLFNVFILFSSPLIYFSDFFCI
ncbi:hypothetical protein XELAEV_18013746mg [Xenopus laevis]|uniref:Secreted protein n=1 Tax=Xenopus laevis TaxID=8355 RepID=A0A974HZG0_XENLA|nr:hypothetical protein XELAEV_18013746mg [Xenopus laevis]